MKKFILVLCLVSASVFAEVKSNAFDEKYYQISEVEIELIDDSSEFMNQAIDPVDPVEEAKQEPKKDPKQNIGETIAIGKEIIAFGKQVYEIVNAGRPVLNTSFAPISVLPFDRADNKAVSPFDVTHWQGPKSQKYKVTYKNGFGMHVVDFSFNVNMSYAGLYNCKGAYITNAQIVPEFVNVAWGYGFDAKMVFVGITNVGDDENPIAGLTVNLDYRVYTVIKEERKALTFFLTGEGNIKKL
jgi:hypothetical protein